MKKEAIPKWTNITERPDLITDDQWSMVKRIAELIEQGDCEAFKSEVVMKPEASHLCFRRMLRWPEGATHCYDLDYLRLSAMPAMQRRDLPKIKEALALREETER